jgi:hypothetical protein
MRVPQRVHHFTDPVSTHSLDALRKLYPSAASEDEGGAGVSGSTE